MCQLPSFTIWVALCVSLVTHAHGSGGHVEEGIALAELEDVGLFCGAILFFSFLFCMTSNKFSKDFTITKTWGWIATTLSIFIAVLVWAWYNFLVILSTKVEMKADGVDRKTIALHLLGYAALGFSMFVMIYFCFVSFTGKCKNCIPHLLAFVAVWSHVVGFALMNLISYTQDYFVELFSGSFGDYSVPIVALAVWCVSFGVSYVIMYVVYNTLLATCITTKSIGEATYWEYDTSDSSEEHELGHDHAKKMTGFKQEHAFDLVKAHLREFSSEAGALALSYTLMRSICGLITGELPEVMQASNKAKTNLHVGLLWGLASVSTFLSGVWATYSKAVLHHCPRLRRIGRLFITQFWTFLTAFLFLQALRWTAYEDSSKRRHSLFYHIMLALVTSFGGLILNLLWCHECHWEFEKEITKIFAVLAAFTWELCLDMMLEQANELSQDKATNDAFDSLLIAVLIVILTPMFIFGVYPNTTVKDPKSGLGLGKSAQEASEFEEEEEDSDEELLDEDHTQEYH